MKATRCIGFTLFTALMSGCGKSPDAGITEAPQLTAAELADLMDFQAWKLQIHEIPKDKNRLRVVVMDGKGTILAHGGTAWLDRVEESDLPLPVVLGMKIEGNEIVVKTRFGGSGQSFKLQHFVEDTSSPNVGHLCKSNSEQWNGDFLHLLGNSKSMGFGAEPFPGATRIIALQFTNEPN
jgi:hypothetical protein